MIPVDKGTDRNDPIFSSGFSSGREKIIAGIGSPLGFFVLALLIVECFLLGAGRFFDLPVETRTAMVWVAVFLFVLVIVIVLYLVVSHPKNLVFSEKSHLEYALMQAYGDNRHPVDPERLQLMQPVLSAASGGEQPLQIGGAESEKQ
jgi:hypothetical protein